MIEELGRVKRNRALAAGLIFAVGLYSLLLPDLEAGTLGVGSIAFLVAFFAGYFRLVPSDRREQEDVESFPAVLQAIQQVKKGSVPSLFGYRFAPSGWMVKRSLLSFDFVPTSDICWAYGKNTKHYVNFIPTYTDHVIVAKLRSGRTLKESYPKEKRDEELRVLRSIAPWAAFGYTEEIEKAWRMDRAAFAAEVDRRRQLLRGGLGRQAP